MMYDWNGGWGWGGWLMMIFMMVAFWGLVAFALVMVVRSSGHGPTWGGPRDEPGDSALRILDERFARGDVDAEDYARRRDLLRQNR